MSHVGSIETSWESFSNDGKGQKDSFAVIGRCFAVILEGRSSILLITFLGGDICGRRIS